MPPNSVENAQKSVEIPPESRELPTESLAFGAKSIAKRDNRYPKPAYSLEIPSRKVAKVPKTCRPVPQA